MALRVNNNVAALNAYRNLTVSEGQQSKSLEKLSSGFRINRAVDDAAGLSVSEGLRSQVGGLKVAVRNAQDGISVVQTAEGALTESHSILQRMRDLAVQAANSGVVGDNTTTASKAIQAESDQLAKELTRISEKTEFNGVKLLDGSYDSKVFQIGANSGDTLDVSISSDATVATGFSATDLAVGTGIAEDDVAALDMTAAGTLQAIRDAIDKVSRARGNLGAVQNRFEHTIANLTVTSENLSAYESRIRDADMAQEMLGYTRSQILSQAGTAMLAQANQSSQGVLSLLR